MIRNVAKWISYTIVGGFAAGWILLIVLGATVWKDNDSKPSADNKPSKSPIPSPTANPFQWIYAGQTCRDGWHSPSIGRQGACSHHGGVVTWYRSTIGDLTTSCDFLYQPTTLERAQRLANSNGNVGCDFDNPRFEEKLPQERP